MSHKGLGQLQSILSKMKVNKTDNLRNAIKNHGNSEMFRYATSSREALKSSRSLPVWDAFHRYDLQNCHIKLPRNGFEELIQLTEEGKLWRYPIDNEQGLDEEKQVPFEDHIFFDDLLEEFPKNENIRTFMKSVFLGLSKNHWMTVNRKHEIIRFYKDYFEENREKYKLSGYDL